MPLVKLRNNSGTILHIDSLGLTIRPSNTEFVLYDKDDVEKSADLLGCIHNGLVSMCGINESFDQKEEEESSEKENIVVADDESNAKVIKEDPLQSLTIMIEEETKDLNDENILPKELTADNVREILEDDVNPLDGDIQPGDINYSDLDGTDSSPAVVMVGEIPTTVEMTKSSTEKVDDDIIFADDSRKNTFEESEDIVVPKD